MAWTKEDIANGKTAVVQWNDQAGNKLSTSKLSGILTTVSDASVGAYLDTLAAAIDADDDLVMATPVTLQTDYLLNRSE